MADKKKFVVGADEPKTEKKAKASKEANVAAKDAKKAEKKAPKAEKKAKEAPPAEEAVKLPSVKELNPKTIMKRVNVKDAEAVKAEVQRLDEIAVAAAEQGNDKVEEAALAASHALSEAAASNEPADVLPLSSEQGEKVKADKEKVSRLKKSEITPEQEMAKLESAKKRQAEAEKKKAEKEAEQAKKKAERDAEQAKKRKEAEERAAQRRDPAFLLAERRRRAEERGKPYPTGCAHCGSPDLVSNRSAYNASIDGGEPVVVQDYICRVCNLYSKAVASTGELVSKESTVKNLGYVQERENYHRAKGHVVEKAIELAGVTDATPTPFEGEGDDEAIDLYLKAKPEAADQIIGLNKLLAVALFSTDEAAQKQARKVLSDGIVLNFDFDGVKAETNEGTVAVNA